ncbi:DUF302 domain-containing protein [Candidatus Venteria ishoeyi]|uniref:DUF302 domain-containing protein n=1 Tax=Candidatus Venteria ishoeyi TaxID=1899563 RepID=A0A1H6F9U3_9GAMM|nr:DUF302 domain-containing protein [Candidatus Venteria ishoeyi]SEH05775.1 Uncharacterised protein [Candidatus Venteria ishoeyi]
MKIHHISHACFFIMALLMQPLWASDTEHDLVKEDSDTERGLVKEADEVLINIAESVIKIPIAEGVSVEDAIDSMKLKANALNMKFAGHQQLSKQYKSIGMKDIQRTEIFQFCDVRIAKKMLDFDIHFLAYMPCRVGVIEDKKGQVWLITMNLNVFITSVDLPPELIKIATEVRDNMEIIMEAGANGDL